MSDSLISARKFRQLVNRVDSIIGEINYGKLSDKNEIKLELIKALRETGVWQQ